MRLLPLGLSLLALGASACTGGRRAPDASASASSTPVATQAPTAAAPPSATAAASALPSATTAALASAAPPASAAPSAAAAPAELPAVEVKNIGMHIGGGPNDDVTKGPIKRSVAPHMDAFRACFAQAADPKKGGDVSVDLRIEKDGGRAQIKKYKSAIEGDGFEACVKQVFDGVDFERPKTGATVVSYSLRFTPKKS